MFNGCLLVILVSSLKSFLASLIASFHIEAMNQKSKNALTRYLTKLDKGDPNAPEEAEIDPSFVEVETILDYREEEVEEVVDDLAASSSVVRDLEKKVQNEIKAHAKDVEQEESAGELKTSASSNNLNSEDLVGKSASQIFNPVERCRKVLEKIMEDPYAISFIEPVDTEEFEDYLDIVEEPICLTDVKNKLENNEYNKYNQYKQFAQDMRKIWRNCKLYNVYKSPIWHSANYLSMVFERLFQAWVNSFADGTMPLTNPIARPWELSCRVCLKDENDEKMMLCDHCDASFHVYCLKPPLSKVPEDAWMCSRCLTWLAQTGSKVMSATAEEEARALVDGATFKKVIRVKKKKYLVKWRGLSYKECTWETAADINDDEKIAEYHKLNDSPPDEPPLTQAEIGVELAKDKKTINYPAVKENPITDLDGQIYAQIRSYHFLKWNKLPPASLLNESGPATFGYNRGNKVESVLPKSIADVIAKIKELSARVENEDGESDRMEGDNATEDNSSLQSCMVVEENEGAEEKKDLESKEGTEVKKESTPDADEEEEEKRPPVEKDPVRAFVPKDVIQSAVSGILSDMLYSVARDHEKVPIPPYPTRPDLPSRYQAPSEIEICIAKGSKSLCMRVGNFRDNLIVLGFKPDNRGYKGPIERTGRIKAGDFLVAINGMYVHNLKFEKIIKLLNISQPFIYLRFLRIPPCIEGKTQNLVVDYFDKKLDSKKKSYRLPLKRSLYFGVFPSTHQVNKWTALYYKDFQQVVIGEYEDERVAAQAYDTAVKGEDDATKRNVNFREDGELTTAAKVLFNIVQAERNYIESTKLPPGPKPDAKRRNSYNSEDDFDDFKSADSYDTVSDLSSDDDDRIGDDDDDEYQDEGEEEEEDEDDDELVDDDDDGSDDGRVSKQKRKQQQELQKLKKLKKKAEEEEEEEKAEGEEEDGDNKEDNKGSTYESEGKISRLLRAVNESEYPPIKADWVKYVLELAIETAPINQNNRLSNANRGKKIEQYDMVSNQLLRTWTGVVHASRALNITTADIFAALMDKRDSAGGFKWKYSEEILDEENLLAAMEGENGNDGDDAEEEEKKDTSWQLKLPTKSKEYKNGGSLRDYQVEGLNWLLRCWYMKRSSILADEMGLGKTVQVVTMLEHLFDVESIRGPFLICVPLSTIGHWRREVEGWSNMHCCLYHDIGGGRDMRDVIREFEWYYKGRSRRLLKFHILITTYDDLTRDYEELAEIPWRVVVVDEAHRLRNVNSKLLECMRTVAMKGQIAYGYQHRILMTGTPLQNNTIELWSLLNFIEPAKFPDLEKFQQRFGKIQTQEQVESLQRRIGPHLLRRVKEDVAKDIPPKEETIIDVELTTVQKQYYRAIFERNHSFLVQNLKGNIPKLMNIQMELRKCCNHPFLINGVETMEMETLEGKIEETANILSGNARSKLLFDQQEFERRRMEEVLIPSSGKMVLLDKLLPKLRNEGHKVLIFSQMVRMIDVIEEFCEFKKYPCSRLDGRVSGNDRQKSIDRFNKDPNAFIFLLSTRAGGVGINLTAADTVIIFDSDWNPQNDIQAMARCHRIGQSKNVKIYRLITRRSFEADMFERASKKLGLEQAVLGTRNFNEIEWDEAAAANPNGAPKNINMDAKEMEKLLREGAYSLLIEDDGEQMKQFYEQDIEQILEQRTHVLVESNPQQTESWLNKRKKTGRTNKRMFTGESAKEHAEIDVDDPDFWKKVLPDLVTPDSMLERLKDESSLLGEGDDDSGGREKFMKDLAQMMDGMLDLSRRSQLPEHERAVCLKLLLRITLKEDIFDEDEITQAKDWLSMIEGTRSRRGRQDIYKVEDTRSAKKKKTPKSLKKANAGTGTGKRGRRAGRYESEEELDEDDIDEDDEDDELVIDEDEDDDERPKKRGRTPKGTATKAKAEKGSAAKGRPKKASTTKKSSKLNSVGDLDAGDDYLAHAYASSAHYSDPEADDVPEQAPKKKRKTTPKPKKEESADGGAVTAGKKRQRKPAKKNVEDDVDNDHEIRDYFGVGAMLEEEYEDEEEIRPIKKKKTSKVILLPPVAVAAATLTKPKRTPKPK